jgi:peptide chain release factor 3
MNLPVALTHAKPSARHQSLSPAERRRSFAIIAHPDAGKTTLTEKLLLLGGAIQEAGAVRARGERRRTRSDWMKIEQQRGISVSASVMTFEHEGLVFNLLDTPGHQDFSEDTYRTLTAVDSAVMVLDAAKGIESQTLKLFEVCRLRDVPIITFINKFDREGRHPFALMEEIEKTLALDATPILWPLGAAADYRAGYDLLADCLEVYEGGPAGADAMKRLAEDISLARAACPAFDEKSYREGHLTPVLFGSALKTFGVNALLAALARYAPAPRPQPARPQAIDPADPKVTGFVFKVQANMDPNHRDRVAFLRLCSGRFCRGMKLTLSRTGRQISVNSPMFFVARERALAEEAFPGDIIGIPNHGTLRIGDALTEGEAVTVTGIPSFAPEILRRVRLDDPMRAKHLRRALEDLAEEGVSQLFKPLLGAQWIVGVVGELQLEVLAARLENEYSIKAGFEAAPYETARWVQCADPAMLKAFIEANRGALAQDRDGAPVFLARNAWELDYIQRQNPEIRFAKTREQPEV